MVPDFQGRIAGRSYQSWIRAWFLCHEAGFSGPHRNAWPCPGTTFEQPAIVVETFEMIGEMVKAEIESNA